MIRIATQMFWTGRLFQTFSSPLNRPDSPSDRVVVLAQETERPKTETPLINKTGMGRIVVRQGQVAAGEPGRQVQNGVTPAVWGALARGGVR